MNKYIWLIIVAVIIIGGGISFLNPISTIKAELGTPFTLKLHQTAIIESEGLQLKFSNIKDSRYYGFEGAPEGGVEIEVEIRKNSKYLGILRLPNRIIDGSSVYKLGIIKIEPGTPIRQESIPPAKYTATFLVEKKVLPELPPSKIENAVIRLELWGYCPEGCLGGGKYRPFTITIDNSGHAVLKGKKTAIFDTMKEIPTETVRKLIDEFYYADFFSMQDTYYTQKYPFPAHIMTIAINEKSKSVIGDQSGHAPTEFGELIEKILKVTDFAFR